MVGVSRACECAGKSGTISIMIMEEGQSDANFYKEVNFDGTR